MNIKIKKMVLISFYIANNLCKLKWIRIFFLRCLLFIDGSRLSEFSLSPYHLWEYHGKHNNDNAQL